MKFSVRAQDQPVWRRFRRNLSVGLLGSVLSLAIKLGQTALLVRVLRTDDFGRVLIVLNLFEFLEAFVGSRVSDVMYRFFQPLREREDARALQGLLLLCLGLIWPWPAPIGEISVRHSPGGGARSIRARNRHLLRV